MVNLKNSLHCLQFQFFIFFFLSSNLNPASVWLVRLLSLHSWSFITIASSWKLILWFYATKFQECSISFAFFWTYVICRIHIEKYRIPVYYKEMRNIKKRSMKGKSLKRCINVKTGKQEEGQEANWVRSYLFRLVVMYGVVSLSPIRPCLWIHLYKLE